MALAVIVNFTVKAGEESKAKEWIKKMEEQTRREPGCRHYIGHQSVEDPRRFMFYELYDDQAALDAHSASSYYQQYVTNGLQKIMETRLVGMFQTVD